MEITIGEVANELLRYTNKLDIGEIYGFPFLRAYLSDDTKFARGIMYIIQVEKGRYSACDNIDDLHGNRMFPTGLRNDPFISEKEIAGNFSEKTIIDDKRNTSCIKNMDIKKFKEYLYQRLIEYKIIKFDSKSLELDVVQMGYRSNRIKETLKRSFDDNNCITYSIDELLKLVYIRGKPFNLGKLNQKEVICIYGKLKFIGLEIIVENNSIVRILFDKNERGETYESRC